MIEVLTSGSLSQVLNDCEAYQRRDAVILLENMWSATDMIQQIKQEIALNRLPGWKYREIGHGFMELESPAESRVYIMPRSLVKERRYLMRGRMRMCDSVLYEEGISEDEVVSCMFELGHLIHTSQNNGFKSEELDDFLNSFKIIKDGDTNA